MDRWTPHRIIIAAFLMTGMLSVIAGQCAGQPGLLGALLLVCGVAVTAPVTSLASYASMLYPTEARATGVSWMFGVGRFGGVASAFVGAALLGFGLQISVVFSLLVVPSLIGAFSLWAIQRDKTRGAVHWEPAEELTSEP
ncbi:hypothetical protein [Cupriavidus taiwanensis]|nr:hypothetical protein [Cupriavidus taiwanensis]